MAWLAVTVLVVGLVLTAVLLAPARLRFIITPGTKRVCLRYLGLEVLWDQEARRTHFFFFGLRLRSRSGRIPPAPEGPVPQWSDQAHGEAVLSRASPALTRRLRLLWSARPALRRTTITVARLLGRLWRSWQLESGRVHLTLRSGDPALTGFATGLFWALRPAVRQLWPMLAIDWDPVFDPSAGPSFRAEGDLVYRIVPVEPIWAFVRTLSTMPWRSLVRLKREWVL